MKASRFIPLRCPPAICEGPKERRTSARSVYVAQAAPGAALAESARALAERCPSAPGRVHALGDFVDPALHTQLAETMPRLTLRARFEWYACRGAGFHNDAHYEGVLFGAWCVAGPAREIVFPRGAVCVPAAIGDFVVFDPFEPHAVLDPGQDLYSREHFEAAPASVFVGFEIEIDEDARGAFGIDTRPEGGALLSSAIPINAESGALPERS